MSKIKKPRFYIQQVSNGWIVGEGDPPTFTESLWDTAKVFTSSKHVADYIRRCLEEPRGN